MKHFHFHSRTMQGFTLIELMVGIAVGLFIVAGACVVLTNHLGENRRLLLEARVQQDLRAAADFVTRDLRRAGYWRNAERSVHPADGAASAANPYAGISLAGTGDTASTVTYRRATDGEDAVADTEQFGFRLNKGAVEAQLGNGNWQAVTDPASVTVTAFSVTRQRQIVQLPELCTKPCPADSTTCPPAQAVNEFVVTLAAKAATDPQVQRLFQSRVRLRNDALIGACPAV